MSTPKDFGRMNEIGQSLLQDPDLRHDEPPTRHCACALHEESFGCHHDPHPLPESVTFGGEEAA